MKVDLKFSKQKSLLNNSGWGNQINQRPKCRICKFQIFQNFIYSVCSSCNKNILLKFVGILFYCLLSNKTCMYDVFTYKKMISILNQ